MALTDYKHLIQEFWDLVNTHNKDEITEFINKKINPMLHPEFEVTTPAYRSQKTEPGISGILQTALDNIHAFPDLKYETLELFGENDKICYVGSFTGTHKGEILGIKPTDRIIRGNFIQVYTFEDDMIKSVRFINDSLSMFQQLGQAVITRDMADEIQSYLNALRLMGLLPENLP
ncbi:MAG: ester cyclase [Candidatus Kariarchaeaceae archaeon]|jgi:predicted ester cyclase